MKGVIHGVKVSQFSLILIGFVCATVVILAWTKAPLLASFTPTPAVVQLDQDQAVIETLKQNNGSVQTETIQADLAASSGRQTELGKETLEEKGSGENMPKPGDSSAPEIQQSIKAENQSVKAENRDNLAVTDMKESPKSATGQPGSEIIAEGESKSNEADNHLVAPESSSIIKVPTDTDQTGGVSLATKNEDCKYGKGKWVVDDKRPLYSGYGCKQWLSPMWACRLTQRTDFEYEKLRWQPKECTMEEFTASNFLKRMQDRTLAFVGDSLGRQQFQSLMCMLTGGEERSDVLNVGREYGLVKARRAVRPDGWAYRFPITNTTIIYYWSASLCDLVPIDTSNPATDIAMHMDRPPAFVRRYLHKFNVLVLNTGHHWNRGKLNANRWVMHVGGVPNTNRRLADISRAKNFTIHSIVKWVDSQLPLHPGLKAFFRTISPRHFFNGDWNTGGTCDNTTPLVGGKEVLKEDSSDPLIAGAVSGTRVKLLDITALSELRDEGHISRYSIKSTPGVQDCLHWCLPGVPDTWNEILFSEV